ncbi:MAG: cobalamin biosynthesis protein [Cyclobacteriaceae bacterium]
MIWLRIGIIADEKELRTDCGFNKNYSSDQIHETLVQACQKLKEDNKGLLTALMIATWEVMKDEPGFDKLVKHLMR